MKTSGFDAYFGSFMFYWSPSSFKFGINLQSLVGIITSLLRLTKTSRLSGFFSLSCSIELIGFIIHYY